MQLFDPRSEARTEQDPGIKGPISLWAYTEQFSALTMRLL